MSVEILEEMLRWYGRTGRMIEEGFTSAQWLKYIGEHGVVSPTTNKKRVEALILLSNVLKGTSDDV